MACQCPEGISIPSPAIIEVCGKTAQAECKLRVAFVMRRLRGRRADQVQQLTARLSLTPTMFPAILCLLAQTAVLARAAELSTVTLDCG
jgi:hypothetical protein